MEKANFRARFYFFFRLLKINARTPANGRARELAMSKSVAFIIFLFDVEWKSPEGGDRGKRSAGWRGHVVNR